MVVADGALKTYYRIFSSQRISKYRSWRTPIITVGGPIAVSHSRVTPFADKYLQAGRELGYKVIEDYVYNDNDDPDGLIYIQLMIRHGVRSNAGVEYLQNTAERENLHIAINSFVTKIAVKDKQAEGVYVVRDGRKSFISA